MTLTCERVLDLLPRGPLPPELVTHVRDCRECQASRDAIRLLGAVPDVTATHAPSRSPLLQAELARPSKVRPWWWEALGAMAVLLVTAFGVLFAVGIRQSGGMPLMGWATAGCLLLLIAVGTWSAFSPRAGKLRIAAVAVAAVAAILVVASATGEGADRPFWRAGIPCMATELGATLPLLALLVWMLTRSAPGALKVLTGALAGGAAGVFALHLHCPVRTASHLIVFHVLPWLVLTAVAVLIRRRLRTRSYAP